MEFPKLTHLTLTDIFNIYGGDKGSYFTHVGTTNNIAHYYTKIYENFMEQYRDVEINMLEIGLWCSYFPGSSIKGWNSYFNNAPTGKIQYGNDFYLCRVDNLQYLNTLDIIIEYSMPNVKNITTSGCYPYLLDKIIYISPIIFDINDFEISKRSKTITMFINTEEYRRKVFLDNISEKSIDCINYENIYSKEDLINFYSDVKIMVNIHQTPHHDTFEELRVLGALINGIIIISEDVPLKEEIPYSEYIIWCTYDTVYDTIKDVQENYETYWTKIFSDGKLKDLLLRMEQNNFNNLKKYFSI